MNTVLNIFSAMSLSGALLILALFAGKRFWRNKVSRQWQYYIWLIVIGRLLFPFMPEWNLTETARQAIAQTQLHTMQPARTQPSFTYAEYAGSASGKTGDNEKASSPARYDEETDRLPRTTALEQPARNIDVVHTSRLGSIWAGFEPLKKIAMSSYRQILLIWLAVVLGLLIRKITMYQSFVHYIKAGMTPVNDIAKLETLSAAENQVGVKRPVELCVNPLVSTPMLMGFFRPCIVLPSAGLPEKDFYYIVLHELMHHRRRDILYKWLVQLTVCLHWFNPMVYLMRRELAKACEFSCDAAVLAKVGESHASDYGKTLLDAMAAVRKYEETVGAVPLSENKQLLKERLGAIMNYQKKSRAAVLMTSVLTLGIILGTAFVGVYPVAAAESDRTQEKEMFAARIEQYYEEGSLPLFKIAFSELKELPV